MLAPRCTHPAPRPSMKKPAAEAFRRRPPLDIDSRCQLVLATAEPRSLLHKRLLASCAPCASASSLAHMMDGCTRLTCGVCANPQSVPASMFSRPTSFAMRTSRSVTSSGRSTTSVEWLMTSGISLRRSGNFTVSQTRHSCSWRGGRMG
jgi:hypothetical protein